MYSSGEYLQDSLSDNRRRTIPPRGTRGKLSFQTSAMTLSAPPISWTDSPHCEQCGYDLRALTEPRCPECGKPFDPTAAPVPNIPWLHRHVIGTFLAYWKTVLLATFLPVKFAHEIWGASRVQT